MAAPHHPNPLIVPMSDFKTHEYAHLIGYSWLHSVYFGLGALELILGLALLGVAPILVSPWDPHRVRGRSHEKKVQSRISRE
jgi:hypothetical protein